LKSFGSRNLDIITRVIKAVTEATSTLVDNEEVMRGAAHPLLDRFAAQATAGIEVGETFVKNFVVSIESYKLRGSPRLNFSNEIAYVSNELLAHLRTLNLIYKELKSMPHFLDVVKKNEAAIIELETMMAAVSLYSDLGAAIELVVSGYEGER
jgi:hypothetical protein